MTILAQTTDELSIAAIRLLSIDMIAKAKSGHPGECYSRSCFSGQTFCAPMGMAPTAHVLLSRHLIANPANDGWVNRDRLVLSNGHASALLYSLLHISGYNLSIDDLKGFRQLGSKTPGHPESFKTEGVEVTTGPLGQGIANGVGLAMAQANLAATYNKEDFPLFSNKTYVFCGDGCLQEGVAAEAASLAGHLQLDNLIVLYDDNQITIDGSIANSFTEDVGKRFEAYGWNVLSVGNADQDIQAIDAAIASAKGSTRPTLIKLRTIIGYGSARQGTHGVHGSPLVADDIKQLKVSAGFNPEDSFAVPEAVYELYKTTFRQRGEKANRSWDASFQQYAAKYQDDHQELTRRITGQLPPNWEQLLPVYGEGDAAVGGRKYSEVILNALAPSLPELLGGSADLTSSNYTRVKNAEDFQAPSTGLGSYRGQYIRYGVREHAMGAIMNGISAYGLFIPFAGTFLNFVSYAAGAIRLSALSGHQVIWVATHDSIGLGEDGPTHQPIETASWLRAMPNLHLWRPADGNETSAAYSVALQSRKTPSVLCLSRQNLPQLPNSSLPAATKGGYVIREGANSSITLVATGSEASIVLEAALALENVGVGARVVSLPCWEVFRQQTPAYQLSVFPSGQPILSVEAYSSFGWSFFSHEHVGIDGWGDSAPPGVLYEHFGLTAKNVVTRAKELVARFANSQPVPQTPVTAIATTKVGGSV